MSNKEIDMLNSIPKRHNVAKLFALLVLQIPCISDAEITLMLINHTLIFDDIFLACFGIQVN
jgi:hypothetical protein